MVGDVIHPLNTVFFGPGVYEAVTKLSPVVRLNYFRSAMSPQDLLFKAQDSIPGGGMGHRAGIQPSGGSLHYCEHIALALAGLWQCDVVNLPSLPRIYILAIILQTTEALPTWLA